MNTFTPFPTRFTPGSKNAQSAPVPPKAPKAPKDEETLASLAGLGAPPLRSLKLLCAGCQNYFMHEPATLCYRCLSKRDGRTSGAPCKGCGEACERCLGQLRTDKARSNSVNRAIPRQDGERAA